MAIAAGVLVNGYVICQRHEIDRSFQNEVALAHAEAERIRAQVVVPTTQRLPTGQNFADALERFGLTAEEAARATSAAQDAFNRRQLRAGNTIVVGRSVAGELREITYKIASAGGGYSTVGDLFKFAVALENHKLLDAAHTEMLTTGKVDTGRGDKREGGLKCFGHGGGAPGMNGDLKICPKAGYAIAVLANMDPPAAQRASGFAAAPLPLE
jgi:Beta-lactamase